MAPEQAAQTATQYWLQLSWGDTLAIIGLILSFVGNILQYLQHRSLKNSVYNGLVGTFNQIGWTLGYCIDKARRAGERELQVARRSLLPWPAPGQDTKIAYQEMGDFATSIDYKCRLLHEHVVSLAKTLKLKDARWQGQFFGMSKDAIDQLMKAQGQSRA